ncbi:MAG: hypothetical protein NTAFB09_06310 [Nitrosospira sp.]
MWSNAQICRANHSKFALLEEALNKSLLARRRLCGMGCAKGDDANGATAQGGAVSSERKMRPRSGLLAPHMYIGAL